MEGTRFHYLLNQQRRELLGCKEGYCTGMQANKELCLHNKIFSYSQYKHLNHKGKRIAVLNS